MAQPTDQQSIAAHCIELIAKAKMLPVEQVLLDSTLESLNIDSLDKVSLSFDIEEDYGLSIPDSALAEVRTVGDMVAGIQAAIAQKATGAVRP